VLASSADLQDFAVIYICVFVLFPAALEIQTGEFT